MFKSKHLIFLILLALLLRAPSFLFRGHPGSDELRYFAGSLSIYESGPDGWEIDPVDRGKLFFIILQAPVTGFLYSLTGNSVLSVSLFPFLCSLIFVIFFYLFAKRLYGENIALWVGLFCAVIPFLSYYSSYMVTHTFFTYFFLLGAYFLYRYLENQQWKHLLVACLFLALLSKIRIEGIGIYLITVYIVLDEYCARTKAQGTGRRDFLCLAGMLVICPLAIQLLFWAISANMLETRELATVRSVLIGKTLGNLAQKLSAMYDLSFPGGFLQSDKLDYLTRNYYLLPYAVITVAYDVLKTLFILPARVIPPLFFIFLGISFLGKVTENEKNRTIEKFFLFSFFVTFIYPLFFFLSHSRYVYLVLPPAIIFMAKGISNLELRLSDRFRWRTGFVLPRTLLITLIIAYVGTAYYFLQLGILLKNKPPIVLGVQQKSRTAQMDEVIDWINSEYGERKIPVMGLYFSTMHLENKERLDFPFEVKNVGGKWQTLPLSLSKTLELLRERGESLLVLSRNKVFGLQYPSESRTDYFRLSIGRNTGFTDESLELMRGKRERDSAYQFRELRGLMDGTASVPGLRLVRTFEISQTKDTVKVFLYRKDFETDAQNESVPGLRPEW